MRRHSKALAHARCTAKFFPSGECSICGEVVMPPKARSGHWQAHTGVRKGLRKSPKHRAALSASLKGKARPYAAVVISAMPSDARERAKETRRRMFAENPGAAFGGRKWGKGQAPHPREVVAAEMLADLGFIPEFSIPTFMGYGHHYTADLAHPLLKIDVEIDGGSHKSRREKDAERDATLRALGWEVLRRPSTFDPGELRNVVMEIIRQRSTGTG